MEFHLTATERHLPYMGSHSVTCYPTQVSTPHRTCIVAEKIFKAESVCDWKQASKCPCFALCLL